MAMLNSLRARLVIAFAAVVAIALILVLASLPRLLDGYFAEQAREDLSGRARVMLILISDRLLRAQGPDPEAPRPILEETEPPTASESLQEAFGTAESGALRTLAEQVAQANVTLSIAPDEERADQVAYRLHVPLPDDFGAPGQQREDISFTLEPFTFPDTFWSSAGAAAPQRLVTITLSQPFTYRAQTLETIVSVMTISAIIALIVAVIASVVLAERLTQPIRRLTGAARELSEGNLDVRVAPPANSPEMSELTAAFNAMADRLQRSIEFISRDRDRSRDFLADVSHELRTPIAALRTFNELLSDGAVRDAATRREFLEQSRQQIERLDWLATNLLELSKLDSGLALLDLRPDDLRAVVESAVQQAQPSAERKGLELSVQLPDRPIRQRHDPQRIGQVLGNLIGNAIKFTPTRGRVEVTLRAVPEGVELVVADSGIGIPAAELPYVFDRFYRGAAASESRAAGSGLGLSIVRSVIDMHNGRVEISSAPGKGTQVTITLPRDVAVSSPAPVRS